MGRRGNGEMAGCYYPGMPLEFTAAFMRDGDWYLGWVEELPGANAQERTLDKARESLREAIADILVANRELSRPAMPTGEIIRETIRLGVPPP